MFGLISFTFNFIDILPQLFARLNHPVREVRDTLCTILERIAASAPHALCYPAIVGATQPIVIYRGNTDEGDDDKGAMLEVLDEEQKERDEQVRIFRQKRLIFCPELRFNCLPSIHKSIFPSIFSLIDF